MHLTTTVVDPELIIDESRYKGPKLIYQADPAMTLRSASCIPVPRGLPELGSSRHPFITKTDFWDVEITGRAGS